MPNNQLPLSLGLRDSSVFASYFAGRNQAVVNALLALPEGDAPRCVWLQGVAGVGKTHLLQAVCARAGQRAQTAAYLPLNDLQAMSPEVVSGCGHFACVCVDDLEAIAGRRDWELALFSLYQELDEQRGRLWVSSTVPPAATGIQLRDLASRLSGGLVLTLHSLEEDEQIAALKLRADLRGFELPDDTIQYLLRRLPRDMTSLYGFLDELDQASLAAQRRLTVPFVREVMNRKRDGVTK